MFGQVVNEVLQSLGPIFPKKCKMPTKIPYKYLNNCCGCYRISVKDRNANGLYCTNVFVGLQVIALGLQVTEAKKKAEEEAENVLQLEESRKKLLKVSSVCAVYSLLQSFPCLVHTSQWEPGWLTLVHVTNALSCVTGIQ